MHLSLDRIAALFDKAAATRIAVIGDAMLDVYLTGDVDRISPEAPVPVVRVRRQTRALGGAANVAQNVIAVGARCDLIAAVGADSGGGVLRSLADAAGIRTDGIIVTDRQTTVKTRIVARSQQMVRVDEEDDHELTDDERNRLQRAIATSVMECDALVLEDYDKGVLTQTIIRNAIALGRRRNVPIIVDPKFRHFFDYSGATVFKPNARELQSALGAATSLDDDEAMSSMISRLDVTYLLLTLGENGMALYSADGVLAQVQSQAREVFDVVGAGDTVTAFLAVMLAAGATIYEAAAISNIAAGIEVGKLGAATVSVAEILSHVQQHPTG